MSAEQSHRRTFSNHVQPPHPQLTHAVYVKGRHLGYQRGKRNTNPNVSLLALEGVDSSEAAEFYLGKRVAFVYRAQTETRGTKHRVVWGKIRKTHGKNHTLLRERNSLGGGSGLTVCTGNSGVVRASFRNNLPPKSFGASVRVMLYPSAI